MEVDPGTKFAVFMSAASHTAIRDCPKNENSRGGIFGHDHEELWPGKADRHEETPNSTTNSSVPVAATASGVLSGTSITAIAVGVSHSLALCADGTMYNKR